MQFSKNLHNLLLPKGYRIVDSVNTQGQTQVSLSFPFSVLFKPDGLRFADWLNDALREVSKR
jgi:hypothetical protein